MTAPINIYQRILAVMNDVKYVQKGEKTVNGMYKFVSHDSVVAKIQPALVKHGIVILSSIEDMKQEGNRTVVTLKIVFVNVDDKDDHFFSTWYGFGIDTGDKGIGKAVSYAFKYALLKTFCLETGDDPDNDAKAVYEPAKCHEFGEAVSGLGDKTLAKLDKFLAHCAEATQKHVEDVKREALGRMESFLDAFDKWAKKKDKETL